MLLVLLALLYRGSEAAPAEPHCFLRGAAFLLLEFQNIGKSSWAPGSTWLVSGATISVLPGLIHRRIRLPPG